MMTDISTQQIEEPVVVSAGAMLKTAREAKGLSVTQVAEKLKLSPRQVVALESEDFSSLPGNTFIRGFMRNYARFLELDSQLLLGYLAGALPQERIQIAMPPVGEATAYERGMELGRMRSSWLVWVFVIVGLLTGAGGVFWYIQKPAAPDVAVSDASRFQSGGAISVSPDAVASESAAILQAASAPAAIDMPAPPALQSSAVSGAESVSRAEAASAIAAGEGNTIRVQANDASSWVHVVDADDRVLISQLVSARGERSASGRPPFRIKIGNAPKTQLFYRGQAVDLAPHTRADVATLELK